MKDMKHVKWAFMRSNDPKQIADALHELFGTADVDIFESEIDDKDGNKVCDIWVIEFDISDEDLKILMEAMKLSNINGYIM